ncbi:hypothetical protein B0H19DRAFT_1083486 [Mycena capillaripes]|nr:hypothetical protein B0H19DRAFT_1083486 [Mycena capillaripes]
MFRACYSGTGSIRRQQYLSISTWRRTYAKVLERSHAGGGKVPSYSRGRFWPNAIVTPCLSTGGTGTRAYLNLDLKMMNVHTVDKKVHVVGKSKRSEGTDSDTDSGSILGRFFGQNRSRIGVNFDHPDSELSRSFGCREAFFFAGMVIEV